MFLFGESNTDPPVEKRDRESLSQLITRAQKATKMATTKVNALKELSHIRNIGSHYDGYEKYRRGDIGHLKPRALKALKTLDMQNMFLSEIA